MLAQPGLKFTLIGALGGMAVFGALAWAAGPPVGAGVRPGLNALEQQNATGGQQIPGRQNSVAPQRVVANKPAGEHGMRHADHEIAQWLKICDNVEVQLAKLAEQHAEHKDVKEFAKQMETEHGKAWQEMEQVAARTGYAGRRGEESATREKEREARAEREAGAESRHEHGGLNYLEIHKLVADEAIASANREMAAKKGSEFDRAYIGCQIGAHHHMINTYRALRQHASPDFQKTLDESAKMAERHLAEAENIMKSLEGK